MVGLASDYNNRHQVLKNWKNHMNNVSLNQEEKLYFYLFETPVGGDIITGSEKWERAQTPYAMTKEEAKINLRIIGPSVRNVLLISIPIDTEAAQIEDVGYPKK